MLYTKCGQSLQELNSDIEITNKDKIHETENLPKTANYLDWNYSCHPKFHLLETKKIIRQIILKNSLTIIISSYTQLLHDKMIHIHNFEKSN